MSASITSFTWGGIRPDMRENISRTVNFVSSALSVCCIPSYANKNEIIVYRDAQRTYFRILGAYCFMPEKETHGDVNRIYVRNLLQAGISGRLQDG